MTTKPFSRCQCRPGVLITLLSLALAGCGTQSNAPANRPATPSQSKPSGAAEQEYDIKGTVVSVSSDKSAITIDHQDIPGLMKGMKMEFQVQEPSAIEGVEAGDQVEGRLKVSDGKYTITRLQKR